MNLKSLFREIARLLSRLSTPNAQGNLELAKQVAVASEWLGPHANGGGTIGHGLRVALRRMAMEQFILNHIERTGKVPSGGRGLDITYGPDGSGADLIFPHISCGGRLTGRFNIPIEKVRTILESQKWRLQ
jgi:hypothetical protein